MLDWIDMGYGAEGSRSRPSLAPTSASLLPCRSRSPLSRLGLSYRGGWTDRPASVGVCRVWRARWCGFRRRASGECGRVRINAGPPRAMIAKPVANKTAPARGACRGRQLNGGFLPAGSGGSPEAIIMAATRVGGSENNMHKTSSCMHMHLPDGSLALAIAACPPVLRPSLPARFGSSMGRRHEYEVLE